MRRGFKRSVCEHFWPHPHPHEQSTLSTTAAQVHSSPTASSSTMTSSEEESTSGGGGEGGVGCPIRVTAMAPRCETECAKQFLHEMIRNHKY